MTPSSPLCPPEPDPVRFGRTFVALPAAVLLLLLSAADPGIGEDGGETILPVSVENSIRDRACLGCHTAEEGSALASRFAPVPAPNLHTSGREYQPEHLRRFLADPQGVRPGTSMPDVLAGLDAGEKSEVIEDLVHFLGSRGGLFDRRPQASTPAEIEQGERLFSTIGCRACHEDDPAWRRSLAEKTNVTTLTAHLLDPHHRLPSGVMPSLRLTEDEAHVIALHLLRDQARNDDGSERITEVEGLRYRYFEGKFSDCGPALLEAEPVGAGTIREVGLPPEHREDFFGVILEGEIEVPVGGSWTFGLTSDDGSRLWIDGREVVVHEGLHAPSRREGSVDLDAGWHGIRVSMFEYSGGEELSLDWSGPGVARAAVPPAALRARTTVHDPGGEKLAVDRDRRRRGQARFMELGCATCHSNGAPTAGAPPLAELSGSDSGCLETDPARRAPAPSFAFEAGEREALVDWVAALSAHDSPAEDGRAIELAFDRFSCRECHARDGEGGPTLEESPFFTGTAELGDEGRLPPDLSGVGAKLRHEALERVIGHGESVRPYMVTRMPSYGSAVGEMLAERLHRQDGGDDDAGVPEFGTRAVEIGRELVGGGGFRCIDCHGFAGHDSLGEPAIDLATLEGRLQPRWYHEYMKDPLAKRPGTRMPAFWAEGLELFPDVLDGDADRQIDATWTYLSLGESAPLPPGLVVDRRDFDLVPVDEPILFGAFFEGLSPRTICCGFPERLSLAYDAEHSRLALLWRGDFMNARGTWQGRAGQLETPEGSSLLTLPPGDAIVSLEDASAPWPILSGREAGWRHAAVRRDAERRPIFRRLHAGDGVEVEESIRPRYDAGGSTAIRSIRVWGGESLLLRLAVAGEIEREGEDFRTDAGVLYRVAGGIPTLVDGAEGRELRVRIPAGGGTIEVEVQW